MKTLNDRDIKLRFSEKTLIVTSGLTRRTRGVKGGDCRRMRGCGRG